MLVAELKSEVLFQSKEGTETGNSLGYYSEGEKGFRKKRII